MNCFLTHYSSIFRNGIRGKLFRSASSSSQLGDSHPWDSIYNRLGEREKSIQEPFYAIGRMPVNVPALANGPNRKHFWRARLFHPDMVKTGLVSGGYTKAEADIFYKEKYVDPAGLRSTQC